MLIISIEILFVIAHTLKRDTGEDAKRMVSFLKKFYESTSEISSHVFILLVSLFAMVFLLSLLPALIQLVIILIAAFSK
jgi:hypothetical protein